MERLVLGTESPEIRAIGGEEHAGRFKLPKNDRCINLAPGQGRLRFDLIGHMVGDQPKTSVQQSQTLNGQVSGHPIGQS